MNVARLASISAWLACSILYSMREYVWCSFLKGRACAAFDDRRTCHGTPSFHWIRSCQYTSAHTMGTLSARSGTRLARTSRAFRALLAINTNELLQAYVTLETSSKVQTSLWMQAFMSGTAVSRLSVPAIVQAHPSFPSLPLPSLSLSRWAFMSDICWAAKMSVAPECSLTIKSWQKFVCWYVYIPVTPLSHAKNDVLFSECAPVYYCHFHSARLHG